MKNKTSKPVAASDGDKVTTKEALEILGIARSTLNERIKEGMITPLPKKPALKRARTLEFRRADVEKLKAG